MKGNRGKLLIISGPSGVGKSTVIDLVMSGRDTLCFSVSATTRKPREGEINGVDYFFVTKKEFNRMILEDELLEYTQYVGNFYGTPKSQVLQRLEEGIDVILDVEIHGARNIKKQIPEAVSIFIAPDSLEELKARLQSRGTDSEEMIQKRLAAAAEQIACSKEFDYIVVNDTVENAADAIRKILDL